MPREIETHADLVIPTGDFDRQIDLQECFGNGNPVEVDVGCGKGRFLLARASSFPETNFVGIDRQYSRVRKVARKASRAGLANIRMLRIEATYAIEHMLPDGSVSAFYVLFPDPWPKRRHHRRRIFNEAFMDVLFRKLRPGGLVHAATDHDDYCEAIQMLFRDDTRFAEEPPFVPSEEEKTGFQIIFESQGISTGRCSIRKRAESAGP